MSLYHTISNNLLSDFDAKVFYRFEGANTVSRFNFDNGTGSKYFYFSKSLEHHKYFILKRLKQLLSSDVYDKLGYHITYRNLSDYSKYPNIKRSIVESEDISNLSSYKLLFDPSLYYLINGNCINNDTKENGVRYIERVDRKVRGGGYGIPDEWNELLLLLSFFKAELQISKKDILQLLHNMKVTAKINRVANLDFLFENDNKYRYSINSHLSNDFSKYDIINILESIIEKGMVNPRSELLKEPTKKIKEIVDSYESGREKVFKLLEKKR